MLVTQASARAVEQRSERSRWKAFGRFVLSEYLVLALCVIYTLAMIPVVPEIAVWQAEVEHEGSSCT